MSLAAGPPRRRMQNERKSGMERGLSSGAERVSCKHEVVGSIPTGSTIFGGSPSLGRGSAVEQGAVNSKVAGSNPAARAKDFPGP